MSNDTNRLHEASAISVDVLPHDAIIWRCKTRVEKYHADTYADALASGEQPYDVVEIDGNLLMYGGASCLWEFAIGNGVTTADQTLTYFNNARAAIGVGDSSTAAAATQTDLQAATNKLRKGMEATYPTHTDGTTSGAASIVYRSSFATGEANWAWAEWGIFNSVTAATGRMLQRKVEALGTKSSGTWTLTLTLSLA